MKDINWAVKIYNINAGGPNEDKGLYDTGSEYVFKWVLKGTHTGYKEGFLLEKWTTGFSKTVDIRRQGKYASIGGGKINVDNTTGFYIWIKQNGINLTGKRIQLIEIDLTNPLSPVETPLYTGVVGQSLTHDAKTLSIPFEDISRYRNAKITNPISGKDNQYYPAVFGEVDKTKFVNETDTVEEIEFENGKMAFQVVTSYTSDANVGVRFKIIPSNTSGLTSGDETTLNSFNSDDELYLKVISGEGEGEIRKFYRFLDFNTGTQIFDFELEESTYIDDTTTSWVPNQTYIKFYQIKYVNKADQWSNYQGFQDDFLYTYPNDRYVNIPINNGNFSKTVNSIQLISDDLKDWGKISGYDIIKPTAVTEGQDTGITDPDDLSGIPSHSYTYFSTSKVWAANYSAGTPTDSGVPNSSAVKDGDGSTYSLAKLTPNIADDNFLMVDVKKLTFDPFEADETYLAGFFNYTNAGNGSFEQTSYLYVNINNNFENSNIRTVQLTYDAFSSNQNRVLNNYDENFLDNFDPSTEVDPNFRSNRTWWRNSVEGQSDLIANLNYATGYDLIGIDITSSPNPIVKEDPEIYVVNYINLDNVLTNPGYDIELKTYQYSIIAKISDIDFTKGIYAKWWGRNFDTTDFGTGANNLITVGNDVYNHVCRLQNFQSNDITPNASGWGKEYIASYTDLIDNTSNYGGLQYLTFNDWGFFNRQVTKSNDLDTQKLKDSLLKDMWSFGSLDGEGKEKLYPMFKVFSDGMSRVSINYEDYEGNPNLTDRPTTDIFTQPYVLYDWDEASQKYLSEIRVNNTEQPSYLSSYVEGIDYAPDAEELWEMCKSLFNNYEVINDVPDSIAKCPWIKGQAQAVDYIQKWVTWMGGTVDGFKDRREISFTVSYEFAVTSSLDLGTLIDIEIPYDDSTNTAYGVITKVNHNLKADNPECKVTAFIEITIPRVFNNIVESGSRADNVIETGSRTFDIVESGNR